MACREGAGGARAAAGRISVPPPSRSM